MIFDDDARRLGPIAKQVASPAEHRYEWSSDNSAEIDRGWIVSCPDLADLAEQTGIPRDALADTVDSWNAAVDAGEDSAFARPAASMLALETAPFYAVPVVPVVTNTQGGPAHDEHQRVLDPWGRPVPGLYAVGELGSMFGHVYLLGANLSECLVGGRIAGRRAAEALDLAPTTGR